MSARRARWLLLGARALLTGVLLAGALPSAADGVGLSVSTDTFVSFGNPADPSVAPGLYGRAGVTWLPGRHLELEVGHVPRLTPQLYSPVFFAASAGWWLLPRNRVDYFNVVIAAGVLYSFDGTLLVGLRLSPLVLGGPDYAFSGRLLTLGLLLDPNRLQLLLELQVLAVTVYL